MGTATTDDRPAAPADAPMLPGSDAALSLKTGMPVRKARPTAPWPRSGMVSKGVGGHTVGQAAEHMRRAEFAVHELVAHAGP